MLLEEWAEKSLSKISLNRRRTAKLGANLSYYTDSALNAPIPPRNGMGKTVIASVAKQSSVVRECRTGLPRRCAPRNDREIVMLGKLDCRAALAMTGLESADETTRDLHHGQ